MPLLTSVEQSKRCLECRGGGARGEGGTIYQARGEHSRNPLLERTLCLSTLCCAARLVEARCLRGDGEAGATGRMDRSDRSARGVLPKGTCSVSLSCMELGRHHSEASALDIEGGEEVVGIEAVVEEVGGREPAVEGMEAVVEGAVGMAAMEAG